MADEGRSQNEAESEEKSDTGASNKRSATENDKVNENTEEKAPVTDDQVSSEYAAETEAAEAATDGAVSNGVAESREETEETETEFSETQKETTIASHHLESSVETSTPAQVIVDGEHEIEEVNAVNEPEKEELRPEEFAPEPESKVERAEAPNESDVITEEVVEEVEQYPEEITGSVTKVKKSQGPSEEISEPSIKAQLEDIIKEIDDTVAADEQKESEDQLERADGEDQVYHTWKPKGKYELEHTPVVVEDVVPIDVAPVPEPEPVKKPASAVTAADEQQQQQEHSLHLNLMDSIEPILVPQLLPNGELGSPIEIPAGIPLLARVLPPDDSSNREKIPLERLFTPATDSGDITPKRKKAAFASSDFYAPNHPTIDDQLQLAQNISKSLGDQTNKTSRGQAMYERRKQKSVKWIHQEGGKVIQQEFEEEEEAQSSEMNIMDVQEPQQQSKTKPAIKLVMNPKGVQDHTTVEQHYQQLMEQTNVVSGGLSGMSSAGQVPASPEIVKDIINDMQSPTGKGAALFAKRKKRMDKFIVDETNVQKSSAYQQEQQSVVSNQFSSQTSSSSFTSSSSSLQKKSTGPAAAPASIAAPGSKKKWLQDRDKEQQQIMEDFLKNRESQFKLVKTPWEAVLETGNTSAAFQQSQSSFSSSSISSSFSSGSTAVQGSNVPSWLEMPKPVPVTAPVPKSGPSAPLPTPPSLFSKPASGPQANEGGGGTGLIYTAEVKLVQTASQPKPPAALPSAAPAPAPFIAHPMAPNPVAPGPSALSPAAPIQVAARPVMSPMVGAIAGHSIASQAELDERRKSMNFNLAANGWGNYNKYYRPISFAS